MLFLLLWCKDTQYVVQYGSGQVKIQRYGQKNEM